ncbi:MAG: YHS domain-containing protein [Sideroxydans sp.]
MNEILKDPVCHMEVPATSLATEYVGIHYAFCSEQCKERFQSNPHLYVGLPGHKAPAQQGRAVIKRRRLALSIPLDEIQAEQVRHALFEMMGIREVSIDAVIVEIQYDLIQATAEQIANKLGTIGVNLGVGWNDRIKLAFINYLEECEIDNLEIENKKGCH